MHFMTFHHPLHRFEPRDAEVRRKRSALVAHVWHGALVGGLLALAAGALAQQGAASPAAGANVQTNPPAEDRSSVGAVVQDKPVKLQRIARSAARAQRTPRQAAEAQVEAQVQTPYGASLR